MHVNQTCMKQSEIAKMTDAELGENLKHSKPSPLIDAFFIGFLVGILIYSAVVNSWGLVSLVPLLLVRAFLKKPKTYAALQTEWQTRQREGLDA